MLKHFTAALAALFFLFPLSAVGESLDLSQLGAIEEAEHWEERAWYQREDGSDWRVQDDGSVIVTLSATGDVTIGGDTRASAAKASLTSSSRRNRWGWISRSPTSKASSRLTTSRSSISRAR